jgi:hypothetical protein
MAITKRLVELDETERMQTVFSTTGYKTPPGKVSLVALPADDPEPLHSSGFHR